ncbi:T6A37 threonylcarbamoyladenosine biosynthesis protein RimN [Hondaea fermentalgiana]|uniref:Threonylcarbamoyl-AMP synthase n=1 Tax=Hondaea fermentalgiana TaxID=2315210 RepID=A0A2R5G8H5_9STRA|nr:T6A37 threonylcarbamoyladenosine biosynthesis protein RimN [Hondaea fermentalgiana]|eukprot:GBG27366.1 T6A37 threonylcarbamoyladenosine biosynthesis protein RimN [Hondaea fermentalgiana]
MKAAARKAVLVAADAQGLRRAGEALRKGANVAFPTETVYGLGGNALDEVAVQNIFTKKGRPLTDPLIVHVLGPDAALELVKAQGSTRRIFDALATAFWPGPLTMVLQAKDVVPSKVCAGTGFVGVRSPAHDVARRLLEESNVPVAAPSANRFGHVSPTTADHVLDDLGDQDVMVVDGGPVELGTCSVGIESTVLKVADPSAADDDDTAPRELVLFRKGGVPEAEIRRVLDSAGFVNTQIVAPSKSSASKPSEESQSRDASATASAPANPGHAVEDDDVATMAPGQLITHYAPDVDTWLLEKSDAALSETEVSGQSSLRLERACDAENDASAQVVNLASCVVLDFGGALQPLQSSVLAYRELSQSGDAAEAARELFSALRWTESTEAKHVLVQDASHAKGALAASVADRMFRAASGKVAVRFTFVTSTPANP